MKRHFLTIALLGMSSFSYAGVYDLTLRRVAPSADVAACQGLLADAVVTFERQAPDARVIDYGCQADDFTMSGLDAVITYEAPARLRVTSTYTASVYSAAFYSDVRDCRDRLDLQTQLFADVTGIEPLAAYCMYDVAFARRWSTRVDGLGEAEMKPESVGTAIWGTLADQEMVFADFEEAIPGYGLVLAEAGLSSDGIGKRLVLRLYAPVPYSFDDYDAMELESLEACRTKAGVVRDILTAAEQPTVVFCETNASGRATLHATALVEILEPTRVFAARTLASRYENLASCEGASESIGRSDDVWGAVCAGLNGEYRLHLFSRP